MNQAQAVVNECAEARAAVDQHYTFEAALTDARFYRSHPEVLIDGQHAKRVINTLLTEIERNKEGRHETP